MRLQRIAYVRVGADSFAAEPASGFEANLKQEEDQSGLCIFESGDESPPGHRAIRELFKKVVVKVHFASRAKGADFGACSADSASSSTSTEFCFGCIKNGKLTSRVHSVVQKTPFGLLRLAG